MGLIMGLIVLFFLMFFMFLIIAGCTIRIKRLEDVVNAQGEYLNAMTSTIKLMDDCLNDLERRTKWMDIVDEQFKRDNDNEAGI